MSEEKRQTRLLPFRLRRAGGARRGAALSRMQDDSADAELSALLRAWPAPAPREGARARLLEDFRAHANRAPFWRRVLTASVSVPVPVAACACAALVALASLVLAARVAAPSAHGESGATTPPPQEVKVVEVPVPYERVVTRVVYADRKDEARRTGNTPPAPRAPRTKTGEPTRDAETSYFTRVDMAEFQPADDIGKIRIIKKGKSDED